MPYINVELDFFNHPKARRMSGLLGSNSEVYALRLWCYCGKFHPGEGRLSGYTVQEIEAILEWKGERGKLVKTLIKVGFLHEDNKGYYVHDWLEHSGHLSVFRKRAIKANKTRWNRYKNATRSPPSNATRSPTRSPKEEVKESSYLSLSLLSSTEKKKKENGFILPDFIPKEIWEKYIEMRKLIKKPMTTHAMKLAVANIEKYMNEGYSPKDILNQSILNSWQGLFPLNKQKGGGKTVLEIAKEGISEVNQ